MKLLLLILALAAPIFAADLKSIPSKVSKIFTAKPLHATVKSVAPGAGFGAGPAYSKEFNAGRWQRGFDTSAVFSLRKSWTADMKFAMEHPKFGQSNSARDNFRVELAALAKSLDRMPYYGIGPNTRRENKIEYRERYETAGVHVFNPFSKYFGAGARLEAMWVESSLVPNPVPDSPGQQAVRAAIPGVFPGTDAFVRYGSYLNPRATGGRFDFDAKAGYDFYKNTKQGHKLSFGRLTAEETLKIFPFGLQQFRRDRFITVRGRYSSAVTGGGNVVPFYLQDTLGGSTMDADFTLRGFQDYRFRAPHVIYVQTQYDHRIWSALGVFAFYDTGKVALSRGDLNFSDLKHNFGAGFNIFLAQNVWFRMAIAFGSGEGNHPYFGVPKF